MPDFKVTTPQLDLSPQVNTSGRLDWHIL